MKNDCVHCGISFDFYEKGNFFVEGDSIDGYLDSSFTKMNDYIAYKPYSSLEEVGEEWKKYETSNNVRIGLSRSTKPERLIDPSTFMTRMQERETVSFIQRGALTSFLQPIISMGDEAVYGYESLLRAAGNDHTFSPGKLFQVAQKTGLHSLLDQRAREEAVKARQDKVKAGVKSFINFLPSTIYNPDFCLQHTFRIVEKYQINPSDLVFEVVETEKIEDVPHLQRVLERYKKEGMKVALDDVGAGFSTVDMLERLQPDYVKIDRSYIDRCDEDAEKQEFLHSTSDQAKKLGIITLAEGIERKEEFDLCKKIGFDLAQGYFIGKPAAQLVELR
ncbi:EAL domain-containing protein [Paenisporosarcina cavernae]|uniref:EAL domain-containing protein n=1 Tax=Paenisporosarcina cavernae TaxID=2320858 RepID=A0A385YQK5_9BACL|nr:EAL domain-containing protein [Paenisporosarcina cavernae]AYC29049.1 EAL domain-containing protein [Paenisporosarcina cavernae]